jgi:hypothetical protein
VQVRALAAAAGLATSGRKDSQGICFLGKVKFGEFVGEHLGVWPGPLVEEESGQVGAGLVRDEHAGCVVDADEFGSCLSYAQYCVNLLVCVPDCTWQGKVAMTCMLLCTLVSVEQAKQTALGGGEALVIWMVCSVPRLLV